MEREQYIIEENAIDEQLNALYLKKKDLILKYKTENQKFLIGEKVEVVSPPGNWGGRVVPEKIEIAFVSGVQINYHNDVVPTLFKSKANGEVSKNRYPLSYNQIVRKITDGK